MKDFNSIIKLDLACEDTFNDLCLQSFRHQYAHNAVYREYCVRLNRQLEDIRHHKDIPFLPVELYKDHAVSCFPTHESEAIFESSSTTGIGVSRHYVRELQTYRTSSLLGFEEIFGSAEQYCILGLLPGYMERPNSSLVQMCRWLMEASGHVDNGFYLNEFEALHDIIQKQQALKQPVILIGVAFALLDFAAAFPGPMPYVRVVETGGMKGRRKEIIREELHGILKHTWGLDAVDSEYGMTELLSQAWSVQDGLFRTPKWMRVLIRDAEDPFSWQEIGRSGGINIIDLANMHTCCFIASSDIGRMHTDGRFEVLGRFDQSELRGCSLMVV